MFKYSNPLPFLFLAVLEVFLYITVMGSVWGLRTIANTRDLKWFRWYRVYTVYHSVPSPLFTLPPPPHYDFRQQQGINTALRSVVDPDWICFNCAIGSEYKISMDSRRKKNSCFERTGCSLDGKRPFCEPWNTLQRAREEEFFKINQQHRPVILVILDLNDVQETDCLSDMKRTAWASNVLYIFFRIHRGDRLTFRYSQWHGQEV